MVNQMFFEKFEQATNKDYTLVLFPITGPL